MSQYDMVFGRHTSVHQAEVYFSMTLKVGEFGEKMQGLEIWRCTSLLVSANIFVKAGVKLLYF